MIVKFVSIEYIKNNSTLEDNVDDDKITPFIHKAQDIHLQHILGSSFMEHLYSQIIAGTLTPAEDTLIRDYIQRCVSEWVIYEILPMLNFKLTNKSIAQESSEYSSPSDLSDIKYIRASVRDVAEFYSERLRKYLCDHSNLFPEYVNPDTPENLNKDNKTYFSGIYFKNKGNCGC